MPLPESQLGFMPAPSSAPVLSDGPSQANPIGLGPVAAGGDMLDLVIKTVAFSGNVDIYLAVFCPQVLGSDLFLFSGGTFLAFSNAGLVPWIAGTSGPLDEKPFGALPLSSLPSGVYTLFLAVAPAGSSLENVYLWSVDFTIP